jgi:hypothetical protein
VLLLLLLEPMMSHCQHQEVEARPPRDDYAADLHVL